MTTRVSTTSTGQAADDLTTGVAGVDGHGACAEPYVPVPAGLLAEAIELLAVGDELIGQRRGSCVSVALRELLARKGITDASVTSARVRAGFGSTSRELSDCLDETGIWVDAIYLPIRNGRIS